MEWRWIQNRPRGNVIKMAEQDKRLDKAMNTLAKWRSVYAGWRLGTTSKNDGQYQYTKDLHEQLLLLRAEVSACFFLFLECGLTHEQVQERMIIEFEALSKAHEGKFPGYSADMDGIHMNVLEARDTMRRLGFPP